MNKREKVQSLLNESQAPGYVPAGFFIHFPRDCHRGQPAIDKHLEYFRYTGMDFVKIQYELSFPHLPEIASPDDWARMPSYRREFFQDQVDVVEGLVKAIDGEALVIQTLYSPFMSAGHTSGGQITEHIRLDPEKVKGGLEVITDSILWFVRACVKVGVDGFYASTQGGERARLGNSALFLNYVKPYDLAVMEEINRTCTFNILHVCDYHDGYDDFTPYLDYPGHIVNCPLEIGRRAISPKEAARIFGRPYMGGMDRHGIIATGTQSEIKEAAMAVLRDAPERFILGADCTLPGDIDWDNIKTAISTAHEYR